MRARAKRESVPRGFKDTPRGLGCRLTGECGYRAENHNIALVGFVHAARSFDFRGTARGIVCIRWVHMAQNDDSFKAYGRLIGNDPNFD
jgi:hypothetical protein